MCERNKQINPTAEEAGNMPRKNLFHRVNYVQNGFGPKLIGQRRRNRVSSFLEGTDPDSAEIQPLTCLPPGKGGSGRCETFGALSSPGRHLGDVYIYIYTDIVLRIFFRIF
jgi:hypothetical protein